MNNAIYNFREPVNEPVLSYLSGSRREYFLKKNWRNREKIGGDSVLLSTAKR